MTEIWSEVKLGDLVNLINGRGFKSTDWTRQGLPIIRISNLNGDTEFNYFNGDFDLKHVVTPGSLLFSWSGNRGTSFGPYIWKNGKGLLNQHIFKVEPKNESNISLKYLYYSLLRLTILVEQSAHGGSGLVHVKKSDMVNFELSMPLLKEQQKIAAILSSVDDAIDKTEQIIEQTERVKQGILKQLLTKGINHDSFIETPIGQIPDNWSFDKLNNLSYKITDGTHKTPNYIENGVPFLRVTDLKNSHINLDKVKRISVEEHNELIKRCRPEQGDVLISKNGTIGLTRVVNWDFEFSIFVSLALIKLKNEIVLPKYIEHFLKSEVVWTQLRNRAKKGTVTNLHLVEIKELICGIPPLDEQKEIISIVNSFEEKIILEHDNLSSLKKLKKGLMQQLLTGKVRVPVDENEVMSQ